MANSDNSKISEQPETIDEFFAKVSAHLGPSPTREEKLAALRIYLSEDEAQEIMRGSGFIDVEEMNVLLGTAATREEKLAILRKYYPEDEAQEEMRLIDLEPLVGAAATREEKLAILRQHVSEETAQARLPKTTTEPAASIHPPLDEAAQARIAEVRTRVAAATTREEKLAVLREYVPEEKAEVVLGVLSAGEDARPQRNR